MKPVHRIATVLLLASLCGCAKTPLENIPLVWKPTSQANFGAVNLTEIGNTKVQVSKFRDLRKPPELIAENREQATPKPVTTRDDVGEFVARHMSQILGTAGLDMVDGNGDVVVSGEVRQFFVEETSTYNGNVVLHVTVRDRAGKVRWNGAAAGAARRFGRSYSAENYYETLSDAVVDATGKLLHDADFRRALVRR